jgi:flagellar biosynthesis/type III secretory pathway protein FliH
MRPKSPFLQNLRRKTPQPKMKQRGGAVPTTAVPKAAERGFQPFQWEQGASLTSDRSFETFAIHAEAEPEPEIHIEPEVDIEAEKRKAFDQGYAKAKAEFLRYKSEAERLEKGFQEILGSVQESRLSWVQEVREGVAESIQIALHHIAQHPKLQAAILAQKLSEAMTQLAEEKELSVFVDPSNVELAEKYLAEKVGWSVQPSTNIGAGAILESTNGVWDARMQVTLDEIDDLLAAWMVDLESSS